MQARKLLAIVLSLTLVSLGCGIKPPPTEPEPPVWQPPEDQQCHINGQVCNCYHRPPDGSENPPWLYLCCEGGENVSWPTECPVPECPECPTCPECPECEFNPQCETFTDRGGNLQCTGCDCYCGREFKECEVPQPGDCPAEIKLEAAGEPAPQFHAEVLKATQTLGDLTGGNPNSNLDKLAVQLRKQLPNRCIISGIEAIFIHRDGDKLYEENHAVFFGNGAWTNNGRGKYIGSHRDTTDPVDPPQEDCPLPHPNPNSMKFNIHDKGNHIDTTYTTVMQCEFCEEIGLGEHGGQPRCGCPIRPECGPNDPPDYICHEREACERLFIGDQKGWCNGNPLENYRGNPAQFKPCSGRFKTCTEDGKTCSEADL